MHFDGTLILLYFIEMLPRTVSNSRYNRQFLLLSIYLVLELSLSSSSYIPCTVFHEKTELFQTGPSTNGFPLPSMQCFSVVVDLDVVCAPIAAEIIFPGMKIHFF